MGAPQADPPPANGTTPKGDGENIPKSKNSNDNNSRIGKTARRDESTIEESSSEANTASNPTKWGDQEDMEEAEWHTVETKHQKKMSRLRQIKRNKPEEITEKADDTKKAISKGYKSPSYMTKVHNKIVKNQRLAEITKATDKKHEELYEYAQKQFPLLPKLRGKKQIEEKILNLMKTGEMQFKILPTFLLQIFTTKTIARLQTLLTKLHSAELYAQLSPGHRLSADLPDYAIMRNVCTNGEVPPSVLSNIQSFKIDATDVYYISARRILVFRFSSKEKADFWNGKELPYQNKPVTLNYYFNNEAHQSIPPTLLESADLSKAKTVAEQLQIMESCRTKVRYSFAIVNTPPILQHAHVLSLLEDTLHLEVGNIKPSINAANGNIRKSAWEITLKTEGIPLILQGKTAIHWAEHKLMLYHHTIHTSIPCSKCFSHQHIYAQCKITSAEQKHNNKILKLRQDMGHKTQEIDFQLQVGIEQQWKDITANNDDDNFIIRIQREIKLDRYALSKDIDTLIAQRKKQNLKKAKTKN